MACETCSHLDDIFALQNQSIDWTQHITYQVQAVFSWRDLSAPELRMRNVSQDLIQKKSFTANINVRCFHEPIGTFLETSTNQKLQQQLP